MKNFRLFIAAIWFIFYSGKLWNHDPAAILYGMMAGVWCFMWYVENFGNPFKHKQGR